MNLRLVAILLAAPLGACADNMAGTPAEPAATTAQAVASRQVVETPFLLAFKVPTCLGVTLASIPSAIASAIVPFADSPRGSGGDYLAASAKDACGPPYVVSPYVTP